MKKMLLLPLLAISLIGCNANTNKEEEKESEWQVLNRSQVNFVVYVGSSSPLGYSLEDIETFQYKYDTYENNLQSLEIKFRTVYDKEKEVRHYFYGQVSYIIYYSY